jgi:hypothetical protein
MNRETWLKIGRGQFVEEREASGDARGKILVFNWSGAAVAVKRRWQVGLDLLNRLAETQHALKKFGRGRPWVKTV